VTAPVSPLTVVALVAAHQRADTVGATVRSLRGVTAVAEVVVVDDGSTDATAAEAATAGARVERLARNAGKGGAVAAGVAATPHADVYLLVDADVGATAARAAALLPPVLDGSADMAIGVLPGAGGRGGFGLVRRLAGAGITRATGFRPRAPLSGQRAVRASLLRRLEPAPRFGLETALTIDALRAGARVVELDVALDHRHTGRRVAGFRHRAGQGLDILAALWPRLRPAVRRRPRPAGGGGR
jgi:glycosyltransferase involved in cell wall biosynthesis